MIKAISQLSIRLFGSAVCLVLRAVPEQYRFGSAVSIVRIFPYGLRHTLSLRLQRMPGVSSVREAILSIIMEAMDRRRIRFDPVLTVEGFELFHEALLEGRGIMLVGTHANGVLSRAAFRLLYDAKLPLRIIALSDPYMVCGTGTSIPSIHPSGTFMLKVRTRLRKAEIVCGLIDDFNQSPKWPLELQAGNGSIWANDSLIRLGLACNAQIIFAAARLARDGSLAITFQSASELQTAEACWRQFVSFFEQHMACAC